jgi:hypothetical protein
MIIIIMSTDDQEAVDIDSNRKGSPVSVVDKDMDSYHQTLIQIRHLLVILNLVYRTNSK